MTTSLSGFSQATKAWAERTKQDVDDVIVASIMKISRPLIMLTPVGNPDLWETQYPPAGYTGGQAKGNWFASIGTPSSRKEFGNTDEDGEETLMAVVPFAEDAAGKVFYLTNNMPYIRRLEYEGWSGQRPAGWVRTTVTNFQNLVDKAINETI